MALLVRTFRTVVEMPSSTLAFLDWAWQWSAPPQIMEPTSVIWADDLFPPCSTKCLVSCNTDDFTDSSGSEMRDDDEEEEEWSSDEEWDSDCDDEWNGFSLGSDGHVEFWGDRWFWTLPLDEDELPVQTGLDVLVDVDTSSYDMQSLVKYVMPSMDPYSVTAIDSWIEKYGSSRSLVRLVKTASFSERREGENSSLFSLPPPSSANAGIFVAIL